MRSAMVQLTITRVRELIRQPEAVFWVFVFPVILALVLGIAFRTGGQPDVVVGVQDGPGAASTVAALEAAGGLAPLLVGEDEAKERIRTGKVDLVVIPGDPATFWFDPTRPESRLARALVDDTLQRAAGRTDLVAVADRELVERGSRYIDFLIPGLIGMNIMGTSIWGLGFSIVVARQRKHLKRLVATPMRRSHYLLAQMFGRLIFLVLEVGVLLVFAVLAFQVPMRGSLAGIALVCLLGAITFSGLGLMVASRARTVEGISGLANVVMLPMWILSGIFFSTSRFPEVMQPAIKALPLTAVNDALRSVMIDGASLVSVSSELLITAVWGAVAFALALRIFRWS